MTESRNWQLDPRVSRETRAVDRCCGQKAPAYRPERFCSHYCGLSESKNDDYHHRGTIVFPRHVPDPDQASFKRIHQQMILLY